MKPTSVRLKSSGKQQRMDELETDRELRFEANKASNEANGQGWVPSGVHNSGFINAQGLNLGEWIARQRLEYTTKVQGGLQSNFDSNQIRKPIVSSFALLERHVHDTQWQFMYQALIRYWAQRGHVRVLSSFVTEDGIHLGRWTKTQRLEFHKRQAGQANDMFPERIQKLEAIGFQWQDLTHDEQWMLKYLALAEYKKKYGDARVPFNYVTADGTHLGQWARAQRREYKKRKEGHKHKMTQKRLQKLQEIGFEWVLEKKTNRNMTWERTYLDMCDFKKIHGHTNVPRSFHSDLGISIHSWATKQRHEYKKFQKGLKSTLNAERIQKLNDIGFAWVGGDRRTFEDKWEAKFRALVAYQQKHGSTLVPRSYKTDDGMRLGVWVADQRLQHARRLKGYKSWLTPERIEKMNAIKFQWRTNIEEGDLFEI